MRLYLVRHGKAEKDAPTGRDEDRPLKPRGIRQAQWLGEHVLTLPAKRRPEVVVSSPLVRAIDTARILHRALRVELEVLNALSTASSEHAVIALIQERLALHALMLVGHNPTLEHVAGALLRGGSSPPPSLRTGEAIVIDLKPDSPFLGGGRLVETLRLEDDEVD